MTYHHGHMCTKRTTGMGFPQGGVCSATFWSQAFNEAVRLINNDNTVGVAFADDCTVLSGGPDPAVLVTRVQHTVDRLVRWGADCGLTFNPMKTQVVFFTRTRTVWPGLSLSLVIPSLTALVLNT